MLHTVCNRMLSYAMFIFCNVANSSNDAGKMDESAGRKNKIQGVSLPPDMLDLAKNRAANLHGGNLSRYIQSLIERDLAGGAPGTKAEETKGERILEELAERWHPSMAPTVSAAIRAHGVVQGRLLALLIESTPDLLVAAATWRMSPEQGTPDAAREAVENLSRVFKK